METIDNNTTATVADFTKTVADLLGGVSDAGSTVGGPVGRATDLAGITSDFLGNAADGTKLYTSDDPWKDFFGLVGGGAGGMAGVAILPITTESGVVVGATLGSFLGPAGTFVGAIIGGATFGAAGIYFSGEIGSAGMEAFYDYMNNLPKYQELTIAQRMELAQLIKAGAQPWEYQPNGGVPHVADPVNTLWLAFKNWTAPRRDPLILDLDGDGIETLAINGTTNVVFDHDGDGLKTGTGWIKGDDGFVVLDRNGNGTIDNGGELFGDQTLVNGVKAAEEVNCEAREATLGCGFAALSGEDSNSDGVFDARDSSFTAVRIWQDTNSDGISQTDELHTMSELGITSINLTSTTSNTVSNGNVQIAKGTYTKTNGTTGDSGTLGLLDETGVAGNLNFAQMVVNNQNFKNTRSVA